MSLLNLNPTDGHVIAGTVLDDHRFVGRVKAAQLFQVAPDPRLTEDKKHIDASAETQTLRSVRDEVQRLFEGAKKKNVAPYAEYIAALAHGQDGIAPVITLYSEQSLEVQQNADGTGFIQIPWDVRLVAIDGETQLAARHEAANIEPATRQEFVPLYITHGRDTIWARQAFHDLNTLGVRPNAALSIGMDARDAMTRISREVERNVPFFKGRVNKTRRQLRVADTDVVTITSLRGSCVTFAKGINGVQHGARPVPMDDAEMPLVEKAAIGWLTAVTKVIGAAIEDRENKVASSPAVLAAIGALGHQLLAVGDDAVREKMAEQLAGDLASINWERGKRWEGIAGKYTPKGAFSIGGAKENAYAVYSALSDASTEGYNRIRRPGSLAA